MEHLSWETSYTSQLSRLPNLRESDSDTESSDEECTAVPISRFSQGDRRARPSVTVAYYPEGDIPERWLPNALGQKPGADNAGCLRARL
jgi:hypothetical protein